MVTAAVPSSANALKFILLGMFNDVHVDTSNRQACIDC